MPVFKHLVKSQTGSNDSTKIVVVSNTESGTSFVEVKRVITERWPLSQYEEAEIMYDRLTGKNGSRRCVELKDLL